MVANNENSDPWANIGADGLEVEQEENLDETDVEHAYDSDDPHFEGDCKAFEVYASRDSKASSNPNASWERYRHLRKLEREGGFGKICHDKWD